MRNYILLSFILSTFSSLQERIEDFAIMETTDNGKAITESRGDVTSATDALEFFAGLAPTLAGKSVLYIS